MPLLSVLKRFFIHKEFMTCPRCTSVLQGDPEGDMYCEKCHTSFKTDWDFADPYTKTYFLTGESYYGKSKSLQRTHFPARAGKNI